MNMAFEIQILLIFHLKCNDKCHRQKSFLHYQCNVNELDLIIWGALIND